MSEMHIKALEQVLGQQMETDGKRTYVVTLDGVPLLLRFVEAEELFLLHIEIGYAQTAGGIVHTQLLGANFLLSETGGAALSLNTQSGMAALEMPLSVAGKLPEFFVEQVEHFVNLADIWTQKLKEWNEQACEQVNSQLDAIMQESMSDNAMGGQNLQMFRA